MTLVERLRAGWPLRQSNPGGDLLAEAADEIERLCAVLSDIERVAGEFNGYPEPADALLAIEQMVQRALRTKGV